MMLVMVERSANEKKDEFHKAVTSEDPIAVGSLEGCCCCLKFGPLFEQNRRIVWTPPCRYEAKNYLNGHDM